MVPAATHRAAGLLLVQRVLTPDASQDQNNHRIRRVDITTGATTTLAGSGVQGFKDDDIGINAQFRPSDVAIDASSTFALVAVRAPLHPSRRALPPQRRTRLAHTPQARTAAL